MLLRFILVLLVVVLQTYSSDAVPGFAANKDGNIEHSPAPGEQLFSEPGSQSVVDSNKALDPKLYDFKNILENYDVNNAVAKMLYKVSFFFIISASLIYSFSFKVYKTSERKIFILCYVIKFELSFSP